MAENFNNKDYAEYFNQLERKITGGYEYKASGLKKEQPASDMQKRQKSKPRYRKKFILLATTVFLIFAISIGGILSLVLGDKGENVDSEKNNPANTTSNIKENVYPIETNKTLTVADVFDSKNIIVISTKDNKVVAARDAYSRAYPASTTKIMTLLTALDYITDYNDTFTMTYEITDPLYQQEATVAGFASGEVITLEDMLYGIILPSGGDASIGVATKIAGSEEAFVKLMNKKAKELGLKDTNFTNCTGLFDSNHYTTASDMAVILREAIKNPLSRKILSTQQYNAKPTEQHPEELTFYSTLFNYMYGTEPDGATILGGKTGFVNESGYCIASFGEDENGNEYIAVNFGASSKWPAFYDQIDLYTAYVGNKPLGDRPNR